MTARILVVDDEPDLHGMITQKFRRQVHNREIQFEFAGDGVQALAVLQNIGAIDVVLTDINMPGMDGLTLLQRIGEQYPLTKVVMVSAYGDMQNIRTALNRGAFDFVTKPIALDDLEITLRKTLQVAATGKQAARDREQLMFLQRELDVARSIQRAMVPSTFPPFPERKEFEIHADMIPAREVGGDFYDFFLLDDDRLGFVIGDVSDKGVPAALFMAVSRTLLRATALEGLPPAECLTRMNRVLCLENLSAMFVTIFYGILHFRTGEVEYCNGGHNPPYVLRCDGDARMLATSGNLVVGGLPNSSYRATELTLQAGETIFLYSDGVTDSANHQDEQFGEERLTATLKCKTKASPAEAVQSVIAEVKAFSGNAPQADDITVLALKYLGD